MRSRRRSTSMPSRRLPPFRCWPRHWWPASASPSTTCGVRSKKSELSGQNVAHVLMARGLVTEADLMWGMAQEMGLEFVDLDTASINFTAVATLPEATARHHNVIVIAEEDGRPVVAASNPTDVFAMDDLRTIIGRRFKIVVATRSQITSYIDKAFDSGADEAAMEASMGIDTATDGGPDDIQAVTEEAPIVRYVNLLILQALNERGVGHPHRADRWRAPYPLSDRRRPP